MKPVSRFLLLSGVVLSFNLILAACSMGPKVDVQGTQMMQQHLAQPYYINAASISVEDQYNPLARPKDISNSLPVPLDKAVKSYAEKRFRAGGTEGVFHYVISDASVYQEDVAPSVKIGNFLGLGNQDKYTGSIKVNIFRDGASGLGPQGYEMKIERTLTMQADVSLKERDDRLSAFTADLLNDIDKSATDKIENVLRLTAPATAGLAPSPGPYPPTPVEQSELR